ncbi:AAA family ATPase [Pontiellaceae bacterium B1224]|nr:AAA family ATPase [Pontiellaceae bacterium B1224]
MKTGITSISIENFKGFGEKVTIPLKPITLLFGANSAGKSTVLQAIAMIRNMLEKGLQNPLPIECSGQHFALGGFRELIHIHDTDRKISFEIESPVNSQNLPISILQQVDVNVAPKKLKLKLEWGTKWYSSRFEISYDDCLFCQLSITHNFLLLICKTPSFC